MGRRIEVELTSTRDDGSWTWRAAGAKQPKGELAGDLLYGGAKIGDVVKVEADFHLDGIEVTEVFPPKEKKERSNLLELKSRPLRDDELVTTQRVARGRGGDRGQRGERPNRGRSERRGGSSTRPPRPDRPQRPKPKRLRPKREHRNALLASVADEHRPIVEQVIRDGMPGVRAAIEKQNTEAKAADKPEIDPTPVLAIAEKHLTAARLADWRDRADAALNDAEELDLRDLRSVVVVGTDVARDEESRAIAEQLKASLDSRMERDHEQWLSDLRNAVSDGRVVRALRLSSRPVKAGAPLPTELAGELSRQAATALAADIEPSRWGVVLDALAFSPVRGAVTPAGIPAEPGDELLNEVKRLSDRIPAIAALFGVDPAEVPKRLKRRRPARPGAKGGKPKQAEKQRKPRNKKPKAGANEASADKSVESTSEEADTAPESETATVTVADAKVPADGSDYADGTKADQAAPAVDTTLAVDATVIDSESEPVTNSAVEDATAAESPAVEATAEVEAAVSSPKADAPEQPTAAETAAADQDDEDSVPSEASDGEEE